MADLRQQFEDDFVLNLLTLAAGDVTAGTFKIDGSRGQGFRVAKSMLHVHLIGKTATEGPITFGVAFNMTAAAIEAAIEADPQASIEDNSRGEGTYIMPLGMITLADTEGRLSPRAGYVISPNWSIIEGQNYQFWAFNMSGGALTTGAALHVFASHFGVWLCD